MMSKEAMKLALEALEPLVRRAAPWGELDWLNGCKAITALREALANEALDKMAENARELGLDYEPQRWAVFCQGCRKEWTVSYPHPGKSICADCDDKPAQQEPVWNNLPSNKDVEDAMRLKRLNQLTSPPAQRKPLTDDQIKGLTPKPDGIAESDARRVEVLPGVMGTEYDEVDAWSMPLVMQIARAIEAAHGIKENT